MLGIIIQARMASTRLPKKILMPFAESNILFFLINRLKQLNLPIVVATSTDPSNDELCKILNQKKIQYFRGSEDNVLQRYIDTAQQFNFTSIIRVCSDSPLIDIKSLKNLISQWQLSNFDYLSYSFDNTPTVLCHFGVFAEICSLKSIKKIHSSFNNLDYNEHVTYGLYKNPNLFKVHFVPLPNVFEKYKDIRLTIDTKEDYENLKYIYQHYMKKNNELSFEQIAELIIRNKELLYRMQKNIIQNTKK